MRQVRLVQSNGIKVAIDAEKVTAIEDKGANSAVHLDGNVHLLVRGEFAAIADRIWPDEAPIA